jgi:hypothetical protein
VSPHPELHNAFRTPGISPRYIDPSERDLAHRLDAQGNPFQAKARDGGPTRLNPAWTDITQAKRDDPGYRFEPVQSVRYDWLLTHPANHIVVGLEKPWEHPEAFGCRGNEPWWLRYAQEMEEAGRTGHPTLSATFSRPDEGGAVSSGGQAIIGGELVYQNAGRWLINNNSGRFGVIRQRTGETHEQHVERVHALLEYAKSIFYDDGDLFVMTQRMSTSTGFWGDAKRWFQGKMAQSGSVGRDSEWLRGRGGFEM